MNLFMEEIDIFLASDDSTPPGVESDYDSEGDILFLEELLNDDLVPLSKYNHFTFDVEPDTAVKNDFDELNEDEWLVRHIFAPAISTIETWWQSHWDETFHEHWNNLSMGEFDMDIKGIDKRKDKTDTNEHEIGKKCEKPKPGMRRKIPESPWGSPIPIGDGDGDVNRFPDGDGDGDGDEAEK
ncbi:hypothetical protein Tco_0153052 [Tanacetum coccineum]